MAGSRRKHWHIPYPSSGWARLLSIILSAMLVWTFFTRPGEVSNLLERHGDGIMALLLWGVAIGLIHGLGFVPWVSLWRLLFNPLIGWPLLLYGIGMTLGR
ncbi:MAG: cyd operon YbgE family protein [Pseudomonadota bacterium]